MSNDYEKKHQLAKEIFDQVLSATMHEDNKAGRIIVSIAFLAGVTSSVFSKFSSEEIHFMFLGRDLISIFFLLFIICVVVGSLYIMNAIGPSFNIPKTWKKNGKNGKKESSSMSTEEYVPLSLYFFKLIAEEDRSKWMSYFEQVEVDALLQKASNDYLYEAHLISEKIQDKVESIRIAKGFYMVSIVILVIITLLGVMSLG